MKVRRHSKQYNFYGDTETGITLRWGTSPEQNPIFAPWPELVDISISNHCTKGCSFCYRGSTDNQSFMSLEQYEHVLSSLHSKQWGSVFQVALGGGEPLEHPRFADIIHMTRDKGIVPNFTTNGLYLEPAIIRQFKDKIGAVAVSACNTKELSANKIKLLTDANVKTNVHFILDNQSIHDAIDILKGRYNDVLCGVNGVIFLTYKPRGRAALDNCLNMDALFHEFVSLIEQNQCSAHVGFDACFVPVLMRYTEVNVDYIDSCECGFFSLYIDEQLNVKPCSFANDETYCFNLNVFTMDEIWNRKLANYRNTMLNNGCTAIDCKNKEHCRGKCSYYDSISFCYAD